MYTNCILDMKLVFKNIDFEPEAGMTRVYCVNIMSYTGSLFSTITKTDKHTHRIKKITASIYSFFLADK